MTDLADEIERLEAEIEDLSSRIIPERDIHMMIEDAKAGQLRDIRAWYEKTVGKDEVGKALCHFPEMLDAYCKDRGIA